MKNALVKSLATICFLAVFISQSIGQEAAYQLDENNQWVVVNSKQSIDLVRIPDWNRQITSKQVCRYYYEFESRRQESLRYAYKGRLSEDFIPPDIKKAGHEKKNYLVMLSADWCVWCKRMYPQMQQLRDEGYIVYIFDITKPGYEDYAALYNVKAFPTFIIYEDGKEIHRRPGATDQKWFRERLKTKQQQEEKPSNPYEGL